MGREKNTSVAGLFLTTHKNSRLCKAVVAGGGAGRATPTKEDERANRKSCSKKVSN